LKVDLETPTRCRHTVRSAVLNVSLRVPLTAGSAAVIDHAPGRSLAGWKTVGVALRFETKRPGIQWVGVTLDLVGAATGGGTSSYSGKAKVVAFNDAGKHRVIEALDSEQIAEDRRAAIQRDYDLLGTEAWCQKYDVPTPFAEG
jgi:hypothetical protein